MEIDLTTSYVGILSLIVFVLAYAVVMAEEFSHLRKSKPVILSAAIIWAIIAFHFSSNKEYAIEIGIPEKEWDDGVNKGVDKYYGSKFDEAKTEDCHKFVNSTVPNGEERVKKVIQTLY